MEKIKKYCLPSKAGGIITGVVFLAAAIFIVWAEFVSGHTLGMGRIGACLLSLVLIVIAFMMYYAIYGSAASKYKKRIAYFGSLGVAGALVPDFNRGVRLFGGKLVAGENFLFGKGEGMIVMYREINSLRRNEHRTDYTSGNLPTFRYSLIITAGGKDYTLCKLSREDVLSPEWYQFSAFLSLKNPAIRVNQIISQTHSTIDDSSEDD